MYIDFKGTEVRDFATRIGKKTSRTDHYLLPKRRIKFYHLYAFKRDLPTPCEVVVVLNDMIGHDVTTEVPELLTFQRKGERFMGV